MNKINNTGVLSEQEIRKYKIIVNGKDENYQTASYDLTLGTCHYVYDKDSNHVGENSPKVNWKLMYIGDDEERKILNMRAPYYGQYESDPHSLIIPPYGSAIIELQEEIDTYSVSKKYNILVVGRFDLKLSKVYQALISQQATQVEPLYKGKLYCFIHNLSKAEVRLRRGEKIATIEFSYAGSALTPCERAQIIKAKSKEVIKKYDEVLGSTQEKMGIAEVRWFYYSDRLPKECGLNRFYTEVDQKLTETLEKTKTEFDDYVSKEQTISKLVDRVSNRIQQNTKRVEMFIMLITTVLSFGLGSLIWVFYQQLVQVTEHQKVLESIMNTCLSGETLISGMKLSFDMIPFWSVLIWITIIYAVVSGIILSLYGPEKGKQNDSKEKDVDKESA